MIYIKTVNCNQEMFLQLSQTVKKVSMPTIERDTIFIYTGVNTHIVSYCT